MRQVKLETIMWMFACYIKKRCIKVSVYHMSCVSCYHVVLYSWKFSYESRCKFVENTHSHSAIFFSDDNVF